MNYMGIDYHKQYSHILARLLRTDLIPKVYKRSGENLGINGFYVREHFMWEVSQGQQTRSTRF